jgi:hypothetical protein
MSLYSRQLVPRQVSHSSIDNNSYWEDGASVKSGSGSAVRSPSNAARRTDAVNHTRQAYRQRRWCYKTRPCSESAGIGIESHRHEVADGVRSEKAVQRLRSAITACARMTVIHRPIIVTSMANMFTNREKHVAIDELGAQMRRFSMRAMQAVKSNRCCIKSS